MSTIVLRGDKGSRLTHAEMDANLENLNNDKYEEGSDIVAGSLVVSSNEAVLIAKGTELQRPGTPDSGMLRFNTDSKEFEGYDGTEWGSIGGGGGTLGTLTSSFVTGQTETITLSEGVTVPVVGVIKEVPQSGETDNTWFANADGAKWDIEDTAYDTSVTPSATTGEITLTLGSGSWSADDVGKSVIGNGGRAVLLDTAGNAFVEDNFLSTVSIVSGTWSLLGIYPSDSKLKLSGFIGPSYDLDNMSFDGGYSVSAQDGYPAGVAFSSDGTKMYVVGFVGDAVFQYTLTTPWDVLGTVTFNGSYSVSAQDGSPTGVAFSSDGTKMYVIGDSGNSVYQYTLTTPWDVLGTVTFNGSYSVSAQEGTPAGVTFSSDGTKMYVVGFAGDDVNQYTLTTPWDVLGTVTFNGSYSVSAQEGTPAGVTFSSDGTKMYVLGSTGDDVNQYTLTTPWDVLGTVTFNGSYSVSAQSTDPQGVVFSSDGTKMYVIGTSVYQYSVATLASPPEPSLAITNTLGQIDSTFWTDINNMVVTELTNNHDVFYAVSTDDKTTFQVTTLSEGTRNIVRNNGGTWQYNSAGTYASETWVAASENSIYGALREATENQSLNQMTGTQLSNASDSDYFTLGDTLDLAVIMSSTNAAELPEFTGVVIDYDGQILNQMAEPGVDYTYDHPAADTVRITALKDNNLKVRVV